MEVDPGIISRTGPNEVFKSWYQAEDRSSTVGANVAQRAFRDALSHLKANGAQTPETDPLLIAGSMGEVQELVNDLFNKYKSKGKFPKARKWLQRTSQKIHHYGAILDVFVQHHPEYVSLVWGTMKFLFISVVNHVSTIQTLAKSISQIADRLPYVELKSALYPTARMEAAVEDLYSCLLKFLMMAHAWLKESKLSHIIHSITRPPELHYTDVLQSIEECSSQIRQLATAGAQAELRIVHRNIDTIRSKMEDSDSVLRNIVLKLDGFHSLQSSALINTNDRLTDLQLSQVLSSFPLTFKDPADIFQHHLFLRRRRAVRVGTFPATDKFWLSPKLVKWSSSQASAISIIQGSTTLRLAVQDFGIDVIQALIDSTVPAIWALAHSKDGHGRSFTTMELLKYMAYQTLRLSGSRRTEKEVAIQYSQFHTATTTIQWISLLNSALQQIRGHVYIVLDLATVRLPELEEDDASKESELLLALTALLGTTSNASHQSGTVVVKLIILFYEPAWLSKLPDTFLDFIVPVKMMRQKRSLPNEARNHFKSQVNRAYGHYTT